VSSRTSPAAGDVALVQRVVKRIRARFTARSWPTPASHRQRYSSRRCGERRNVSIRPDTVVRRARAARLARACISGSGVIVTRIFIRMHRKDVHAYNQACAASESGTARMLRSAAGSVLVPAYTISALQVFGGLFGQSDAGRCRLPSHRSALSIQLGRSYKHNRTWKSVTLSPDVFVTYLPGRSASDIQHRCAFRRWANAKPDRNKTLLLIKRTSRVILLMCTKFQPTRREIFGESNQASSPTFRHSTGSTYIRSMYEPLIAR